MYERIDIGLVRNISIGDRFGKLIVVSRVKKKGEEKTHHIIYECICDCGKTTYVYSTNLTAKNKPTRSCGCLASTNSAKYELTTTGKKNSSIRLYQTWYDMRRRCNNPKCKEYRYYGELGIYVCDEWENFDTFAKWALSNGYTDELTIDRIDNYSGYNPSNCRFVSKADQQRNKRKSKKYSDTL